jgi:hypothetical protein
MEDPIDPLENGIDWNLNSKKEESNPEIEKITKAREERFQKLLKEAGITEEQYNTLYKDCDLENPTKIKRLERMRLLSKDNPDINDREIRESAKYQARLQRKRERYQREKAAYKKLNSTINKEIDNT